MQFKYKNLYYSILYSAKREFHKFMKIEKKKLNCILGKLRASSTNK